MNGWMWAATALLVLLVPCGLGVLRGSTLSRLVALQLATTLTALALLLLAKGYGRSTYLDVGLVVAALSYPGGLVFVRLLEHRP